MSLKYGLLGLLNYKKMTGYELNKVFKESLEFFWQGQTSQIYRELTELEKIGSLSSEVKVQTGKPNKKIYSITKKGCEDFINWLSPSSEKNEVDKTIKDALRIRSSFHMKIFFSGELKPEQTITLLRDFRDECRNNLLKMKTVPDNIENYSKEIKNHDTASGWQMIASLGKSYYETCEKWADEMLKLKTKNDKKS